MNETPDEYFNCADCGASTLHGHEYYMLRTKVWAATRVRKRAMLCVGCVEHRLGRLLRPDDFADVPLTHLLREGLWKASSRLLSRLTSQDG